MANVAQRMICFRPMPNESHVRIDEGIKKGPRRKRNARPPTRRPSKPTNDKQLALADPQQVLQRYLNGETSNQIAESFGCTRQALGYFLRKTAPEPWQEAQIVLAIERKEQAEDEIGSAPDPLSLARAREQLRGAQWDVERVFNRIYGVKQEIAHTGTVTVTHALQAIAERRQGQLSRNADAAALPSQVIDIPALPGTTLDSQGSDT